VVNNFSLICQILKGLLKYSPFYLKSFIFGKKIMNNTTANDIKTQIKDIIVKDYNKYLKHAYIRTKDKEIASDLIQDLFITAIEKCDTFKGNSSLETWLFGILNIKILNYFKQKKAELNPEPEDLEKLMFKGNGRWKKEWLNPEQTFENTDAILKFFKLCWKQLKDQYKIVFCMKVMLNKETEEICECCNISKDNLWQITHRAKLQLKACINQKLKHQL
jgi:RNA polymerase sigma-70 factor (ECF subfamily)